MRSFLLIMAGVAVGLSSAGAHSIEPAMAIDQAPPDYPDGAGTTEGSVKLGFTIGVDGRVKDVVVLESSPAGVFDAAALAALAQWRYRPRIVDGQPAEQATMARLQFKPDTHEPQNKAQTRKIVDKIVPDPSWRTEWRMTPGQWVLVECTLTAEGHMKDVRIANESDTTIIPYEVIKIAKSLRLTPIMENGVPVEKEHQLVFLHP